MKLALSLVAILVAAQASAIQFNCSTKGGTLHLVVRGHADVNNRTASVFVLSDQTREPKDKTLIIAKADDKELSGNIADLKVDMDKANANETGKRNLDLTLMGHKLKSYKELSFKVTKFDFNAPEKEKNYAAILSGKAEVRDAKSKKIDFNCEYSTKAQQEAEKAELNKE